VCCLLCELAVRKCDAEYKLYEAVHLYKVHGCAGSESADRRACLFQLYFSHGSQAVHAAVMHVPMQQAHRPAAHAAATEGHILP